MANLAFLFLLSKCFSRFIDRGNWQQTTHAPMGRQSMAGAATAQIRGRASEYWLYNGNFKQLVFARVMPTLQ